MTYVMEITETRQGIFTVEANNKQEAYRELEHRYEANVVALKLEDRKNVSFEILEEIDEQDT